MAFKKKTWKDRLVEFPGRRTLKRISGSADSTMVADVTRNEGQVSQGGDAFSAANMNDLEQRISDGFTDVINNLGGLSFGITANGEYGYRKPGADTVFPFSSFRGAELVCNIRARFYNYDVPTKKDLFTGTVVVKIDKNGNVTLPAEVALSRNGSNIPTPSRVYFSILSVTVNFL